MKIPSWWPWKRKAVIVSEPAPSVRAGPLAMNIHPRALATAQATPKGAARAAAMADLFKPAPVPSWVPKSSDVQLAMDDAIAPFFAYAGNFEMFGEGVAWMGFPYLAELTQRPEYRSVTETRAKEMTRKWIKLTYRGDEPDKDKLEKIEHAMEKLRIRDLFRTAAEHDGFFGRAQIFCDLGKKGDALKKPMLIAAETVAKGSLKGFRLIEPMWSYPGAYNSVNPLEANYFVPELWYVMNQQVHHTRLLTIVSAPVPDILKPAYSFAGTSMSQRLQPYVNNWLRTRQSVSDLIHSFSTTVLKTVLGAAIAAGGVWDSIFSRLDVFNATRDNRGIMAIDKETEEMEQLNAPLGTLDKLQAQSQEQMAAIAKIPLVVLLGVTPTGLNASSDGEIRVFYDDIHSCQEDISRHPLTQVISLIQLNEFGEIDENVGFTFVPLWQLDEAAKASVRKTNADTAAVYIEAGVIAPEEERRVLADDDESPYAGLDPDDLPEPPETEEQVGTSGDPAKGAEPKGQERSGV